MSLPIPRDCDCGRLALRGLDECATCANGPGGILSDRCHCGAGKAKGKSGCDQCRYLDGDDVTETAVITAIRQLGGHGTTEAIAAAAGLGYRHVRRKVAALEQTGRIARADKGDERHHNMPALTLVVEPARNPVQPVRRPRAAERAQLVLPRLRRIYGHAAGSVRRVLVRRASRRRSRSTCQLLLPFESPPAPAAEGPCPAPPRPALVARRAASSSPPWARVLASGSAAASAL